MANRSCGTCRDRRILCDRAIPICTQCSQSNRTCKGYGLRLSWPNANNTRRAVVGRPSPHSKRTDRASSDIRLVNISTWDIKLHHYLSGSGSNAQLVLCPPMPFNPFKLEVADNYLVQYFQCIASRSLTTFGHDPTDVGNVLMRMTLANSSPSAAAVLRSMLALSSLHRDGLQPQAAELKISALRALAAASKNNISVTEAAQHVAAGMLLCSFEIHQASCTSGQWRWYVTGVKAVIEASFLGNFKQDGDFNTLLNWVYYHDVLSRFSLLHWHQHKSEAPSSPPDACAEFSYLAPSSFNTILGHLSDVCDTISAKPPRTMFAKDLDDYKNYLKILRWRIRSISPSDSTPRNGPGSTMIVELFQLAMLVYLNRASGNLLERTAETEQLVRRAFAIFSELGSCERQFPLFILGCEARTDDERCTVLDLISRTEKVASSRSLLLVRKMVQAIWNQDDLADGEIDYEETLSVIISCCAILPTFV